MRRWGRIFVEWSGKRGGWRVELARRIAGKRTSFGVEKFLLPSSGSGPTVPPATRIGQLAMMVLSAPKLTSQILATPVAGMRKEPDSAVTAPNCAVLQIRMSAQRGI